MEDFPASAIRHFNDAEILAQNRCFDNAGHLIGFAAECAMKAAMVRFFSSEEAKRLHFPEIRDAAKRKFNARRDLAVRTVLLNCPDLLSGWDVNQRYAPDQTVTSPTYQRWRDDVRRLLFAAGLKREVL